MSELAPSDPSTVDPGTPSRSAASSGAATPGAASSKDGLLAGLEPANRFRCVACGNVTRFDVVISATTRRFHHFDLGGDQRVEEEQILEQQLRSVTCRWCGRADAVEVEPAPAAGA